MTALPKFPFVLQVCGTPFTVKREPVPDAYGESSLWHREIVISTADCGEWSTPDDRVWDVLAHEVMHMVLGLAGLSNDDNDTVLTKSQEEQVCIVSELMWQALAPVLVQQLARGAKPNK